MLFIVSASTFRDAVGVGDPARLLDLPKRVSDELGLSGLAIPADLLAGAELERIDQLRERADKAACPCLLLYEPEPQPLGERGDRAEAAMDRLQRVLIGAQRLGCSAAGFSIEGAATDQAMDHAVEHIKRLGERAERLDLHFLIRPHAGLTESPQRIAELTKQVGGFRIGALPDFQAAGATDDPRTYMKRLAPYAPFLFGASKRFDKAGEHVGYDLSACAHGLVDVGYDGTIVLDHRGRGDPVKSVQRAREIIETALTEKPA